LLVASGLLFKQTGNEALVISPRRYVTGFVVQSSGYYCLYRGRTSKNLRSYQIPDFLEDTEERMGGRDPSLTRKTAPGLKPGANRNEAC
jgi:hypothetical protein